MTPGSTVFYIALIGFMAIATMFVLELRRWREMGQVIPRRQRILRVILIVLIELLFVMIVTGPWMMRYHGPVVQLVYWSSCLLIGLVVVVLALIDVRAVIKGYIALNRTMLGDLHEDERRKNE